MFQDELRHPVGKEHCSGKSVPQLRVCEEERVGSQSQGNPQAGQRVPSGVAELTRRADATGTVPGTTTGYLNGPLGACVTRSTLTLMCKQGMGWQKGVE